MTPMTRMLSAALVVGTTVTAAAPAAAVPLGASQALREASTPTVQTVQWRGGHWGHRGGWGWGGIGLGLAAGALIGSALTAPYYSPYYYGYAPAYSGYGYAAPYYGYSYAPRYSGYRYAYGYRPRVYVRHYRHYRHYRW